MWILNCNFEHQRVLTIFFTVHFKCLLSEIIYCGFVVVVVSVCVCLCGWEGRVGAKGTKTHKISRLVVPFRSGNSRIWVAPLRELQSNKEKSVRRLSFSLFLSLPLFFFHLHTHTHTRACTQTLSNSSFHPSNFFSNINTGCFGCLTRHHKSHHSTCSYNTLSLTTSAHSTAIR